MLTGSREDAEAAALVSLTGNTTVSLSLQDLCEVVRYL